MTSDYFGSITLIPNDVQHAQLLWVGTKTTNPIFKYHEATDQTSASFARTDWYAPGCHEGVGAGGESDSHNSGLHFGVGLEKIEIERVEITECEEEGGGGGLIQSERQRA